MEKTVPEAKPVKLERMSIPLNALLKAEGEMSMSELRKVINREATNVREVFIQNILVKHGIVYSSVLSRQAKDIIFESAKITITKGDEFDLIYIGETLIGMWKRNPTVKMTKKGLFILKVTYWAK